MKTLPLLIIFILSGYASPAQKDTARLNKPVPVNKNSNVKIVAAANPRVSSVEMTMNQIDIKLKELQTLTDKLKDQKDGLSDLSQQDQMKLQQLMERKSQMETMLSNIMKKFSETSSGIIQNLK